MSRDHSTSSDPSQERTIQSVESACDLLDALYRLEGATLSEVAKEVPLTRGTIHTHLATLQKQGYVFKDGLTYRPSLRFLEVGGGIKQQMELYRAAATEVQTLAKETGEFAHLVVEENGWGYILHREQGPSSKSTTSRPGKRFHLHYTAAGKAILAHLPRERVEQIVEERGLPQETEHTITERELLFDELKEIRAEGVAFDRQEQFKRVRCVGAVIRDDRDRVLGAISISGPASSVGDARMNKGLTEAVTDAAHRIEMTVEIESVTG